ncbi:TetR/AcrR family transcriptional regulator [Acuticoccus mangrovi]|uniref:TetR/AcrR family transcriptional regulator n=1 Tax=Acuticoccus mangrovi TaxID=2796142 RepID=A0A934MFU8_9HYPH|nr:TetR/AcrR family transcriptional regulator [Acuticoccus mangrovi]MBJ3775315.1 TetR/AcrR family transcriptional regulator [Acuticoccus mangrovi]
MRLFWLQGYEATTVSQLAAAMGKLSSASFYAAFGSKEILFREILERYEAIHGQALAPLSDTTLPPREAVERALRASVRMQTAPDLPTGCLVALGASGWSEHNAALAACVAETRARNRASFSACVDRAVAVGDLDPESNTAALGLMFDTVLLGLSIEARDRLPRAQLEEVVAVTMRLWDSFAPQGRAAATRG